MAGSADQDADVLILGGGPAGMSAALWLHNLGFQARIIDEQPALGGAMNFNWLDNDSVLGQIGLSGDGIARQFVAHLAARGLTPHLQGRWQQITRTAEGWQVTVNTQGQTRTQQARALLLAVGLGFRGPDVLAAIPGGKELPADRVAWGPFAFRDLSRWSGRKVAILGGGDNAFENAHLLLSLGAEVDLLTRSSPRAQQKFMKPVLNHPGCRHFPEIRWGGIENHGANGLVLVFSCGQRETRRAVDRLHILAGYEPNTASIRHDLVAEGAAGLLDEAGYLCADENGQTTCRGLFAAGDACRGAFSSVVGALASGARAAKTIGKFLEQD